MRLPHLFHRWDEYVRWGRSRGIRYPSYFYRKCSVCEKWQLLFWDYDGKFWADWPKQDESELEKYHSW